MALLNRLFPSKKKSHKQGYVSFGRNEHSNWKPFNFTREQVRLLLFRECDARGRKLLFDSNAVQRTVLENQQCSKLKIGSKTKCDNSKKTETYVEVTNGVGYQYTRPNSDVTLMGEMIFGSVAMTFKGMTCKVHSMKSPDQFMCSRVFQAPTVHVTSKRKSDQSIDSSGSSIGSMNDSLLSLSGNYETKLTLSSSSGALDVPQSEACGKAPISSLEGDSGFCGDASLRSISSVGSGCSSPYTYTYDSQSASHSTLGNSSNSGGSLASLQRRWMRNISTSLELGVTFSPWNFIRGKSSSGVSDEVSSRLHKTQLGFTVVISVSQDEEKDMEIFLFEHMAIVDGMLERLQNNVEKAYMKKDVFVHLMMDAFYDLQQWLCDLFTAPRIVSPVWIGLASPECYHESSRFHYNVMSTFLRDFCQLIAAIDTKATNFFISTLVTAVLTHHLGWVATIIPAKAPPSSVTKPPCTLQMLHALAKSHPYNALWAQLGDLHGALGNPVKIARTIVTANAKKNDLLNKLLTSLSYFIRCGNIEKKIDSQVVVDSESVVLDSVMENLSFASLNSSTASTSTIVPEDATKFEEKVSDILINECKIISGSKIMLNECSDEKESNESLCNETENSEAPSRPLLLDTHGVTGFKKSSTFVNCLNVLSETKSDNSIENSKSKLYPDILDVENSYLHPDVISEKVSRLCRVPTNAVIYHMKNDESEVDTVKNFLPKKVDCERQLSSVQFGNRSKYVLPSSNIEKCDNNASDESGVIFVLGDNEKLVDIKRHNEFNIPKSKSDNILCSETLNTKANIFKTPNCYPSLEGLLYSPNNSHLLEVNAVQGSSTKLHKSECVTGSEKIKVTASLTNNSASIRTCFSNHEETGLHSGIVLEEETPKAKCARGDNEYMFDKVNLWKKERTRKSAYDNQTLGLPNNLFLQDINGNLQTDKNEDSHSSKIVTSHSFVIELEDVHGGTDVKDSDADRKLVKNVARSQSLSFPDRKSVSFKKSVSICRRHSVNDRYLRDYHSVRFNFERCDGVLSDYVDGIGVEKSPQMEKKSIKICEARGNFELQDNMCEKCKHRKQGISVNTVLCSNDMCDCDFNQEYGCEDKVVNGKVHTREGNALFDEYGTLSDDELLSSTEMLVGKEVQAKQEERLHQPSLIELPLPWYSSNQHERGSGLAASLLAGVSDHYMPDMVLHGCTQSLPLWEATLKRDLTVSAHHPMLDQEVSEAVCIVGNAELWEVQLVSSHLSVVDKPGGFGIRVGMSQLVANMLESLLHLWKLRTPPEQCLQHLESKLRELCLRSQAVAELLLTTELCDMATLTSSLGLEANDVPLLMAIASTHTPEVTNLYGLSFR